MPSTTLFRSVAVGRGIWASIFGDEGWFNRLEKRFEGLETNQAGLSSGLSEIRDEQKEQRKELSRLSNVQQDHAIELAEIRGARQERDRMTNAANRVAELITHHEEAPRHEPNS